MFDNVQVPFTNNDGTLLYRAKELIRQVNGVLIMNTAVRAEIKAEDSEQFDQIIFDIRLSKIPLTYVASFAEYFDGGKQFLKLIEQPDGVSTLNEVLGMGLDKSDILVIEQYKAVRDKFIKFFSSLKPPYERGDKTSIYCELTISGDTTNDKRCRITNGSYVLTLARFKAMWARCYKQWATGVKDDGTYRYRRSTYDSSYQLRINDQNVVIGCQTIDRYAIEEAAIKLGLLIA